MWKIRFPMLPVLVFYLLLTGCGLNGSKDSWERIELGTDAEFRDIFFLDSQNGWIVGSAGIKVPGGILGRTRDGGKTWQYQSGLIPKRRKATSVDLNAVHFMTPLRGVIAAESGVILVTEDGGDNWETAPFSGPVYAHNRDLDFVDDLNGWIVGGKGVLRTEDGGGTWKLAGPNGDLTGNALDFVNLDRGWVVGKFGQVHRTDDGGVTWEKVPALGNLDGMRGDDIPNLTSVHFIDEDHGWIAGYLQDLSNMEQHHYAVIIHTSDGGETWSHQAEGVESLLMDIRFADRLRGWAVGFNRNDGTSAVLNTVDGGLTWQVQTTIFGEELRAIAIRDDWVWTVGDRSRMEPQRLLRLVPTAGNR